jgi:hypothetical protein
MAMSRITGTILFPYSSKVGFIVAIVFLTAIFPAHTAADKKDSEAEQLLQKAEQLTDIRSSGGNPFHLTATFKLYDDKGVATEGTYELLWKSPAIWREEIRAPGFSQTRLAAIDRIHILREPRWLTLEIFELGKLLEFPQSIRRHEEAVGLKLREKTKGAIRERSIEIAMDGRTWKRLYLDWDTGLPLRVEYTYEQRMQQFQDYFEFDGHHFPRFLAAFRSKKPVMEVHVTGLISASFPESSFVPPVGAGWMHWCPDLIDAKPAMAIDVVMPFPPPAQKNPVVIDGIIGTDGKWQNLVVVKSGGREADAFWLDMVRREHFQPARCGNTPVEQEMMNELRLP